MLITETRNENTKNIPEMTTAEMMAAMQAENKRAAEALDSELGSIGAAVDAISERMKKGGRLFYIGCGTSGRLGVLDASECPPTYGVPKDLVIGIIAGGDYALRNAIEGAEDNFELGVKTISEYNLTELDSLVGISVAGGAKFVLGAMAHAKEKGALVIALASNPDTPLEAAADIAIHPITGPEVITGSTRMKAGTAHKMVLNMISTAVMIRQGHVYENLMINLRPSNVKLRARMIRIVNDILDCGEKAAEELLEANGFVIKDALRAAGKGCSLMPRSRVVQRSGASYLEVNGKIIPGAAYLTYFSDKNCYGDFADAGYKLYSVSVFLGQNYINNFSALECFTPAVFNESGADFSRFDLDIKRILEVCPDAMIFPRINVNPPREWEAANPDELTDFGPPSRHPEGRRACLGSDLWLDWIKNYLRLFIKHVKQSDFCESIIGYQLAGGQTEEWYAYDEHGFIGKRSLEKYADYLCKSGRADYGPIHCLVQNYFRRIKCITTRMKQRMQKNAE